MDLNPQVLTLLDELVAGGRPSSRTLALPAGRRNFAELIGSFAGTAEVAGVEDRWFPGPAGPTPVRLYVPAERGPLPLVAFLHGGGWVFGGIDTHDGLCRCLANAAGAIVASVGFRLAPEHPFPAALHDCVAAVQWLHGHASELGGDGDRLAVAGDSSGANLAAGVAARIRDRGGPRLAVQLLAYPGTDPSMSTRSYRKHADDPFLSREEMAWYWAQYLGDHLASGAPADAAPAHRTDLAGLPPAIVVLAGHDVLHDEGQAYAARLAQAGVPVRVEWYGDMVHGFLLMGGVLDRAKEAISAAGAAIREGFAGAEVGGG
jgi:acetyl esterase